MNPLNIKKFIISNSFFEDTVNVSDRIAYIKNNHDDTFGSDVLMYYFNFEGYKISFLVYEDSIAEQVEFNLSSKPKTNWEDFYYLNDFKKNFQEDIKDMYVDKTGETVIFMKSGTNVYFQGDTIDKITSESQKSRDLASKIMKKVIIK